MHSNQVCFGFHGQFGGGSISGHDMQPVDGLKPRPTLNVSKKVCRLRHTMHLLRRPAVSCVPSPGIALVRHGHLKKKKPSCKTCQWLVYKDVLSYPADSPLYHWRTTPLMSVSTSHQENATIASTIKPERDSMSCDSQLEAIGKFILEIHHHPQLS